MATKLPCTVMLPTGGIELLIELLNLLSRLNLLTLLSLLTLLMYPGSPLPFPIVPRKARATVRAVRTVGGGGAVNMPDYQIS